MGFSEGTSPKGGPSFNNTPQTTADLNRLRDYIEQTGNRFVGTAADRSDLGTLPTGAKGMLFYETDTDKTYRWDGTQWISLGLQHAEFLFTRSAIFDGIITLFSTAVDASKTNDTTFATIPGASGQTVTLVQAGLYAIDFYFQVAAASTGRFAGAIMVTGTAPSPTGVIAQNSSPSGENALSCGVSNFRAAANTPVLFQVEKNTGSTPLVSTRICVTRLGN